MLDLIIQLINNNRIFNGFSTLAMYIGGKYLTAEIPGNVEKVFNYPFFRRLFIFFIMFLAFRDIKIAVIVTLIFIIVFNYLLDEKSKVFIGKIVGYTPAKNVEKLGVNAIITADEIEKAKDVIKRYNQTLENQKIKMWELK